MEILLQSGKKKCYILEKVLQSENCAIVWKEFYSLERVFFGVLFEREAIPDCIEVTSQRVYWQTKRKRDLWLLIKVVAALEVTPGERE